MTTLTSWGHACVSIDSDRRLVIDPGTFSDLTVLDSADAILITHDHVDHLAVDPVAQALTDRAELELWGPRSAVDMLVDAGAPADRVHVVGPGESFTAAGFSIRTVGEEHLLIHPDIPRPQNLGYLIDEQIFHPGDSLTEPGVPVQVLFVPVSGPWMQLGQAIDYVRAVAPQLAVPIHDAILSEPGKALSDRMVGGLGGAVEYRRLDTGQPVELSPVG